MQYRDMKLAIIRLPYGKVIPRVTPIGNFHNLHGIWNPPPYVLGFWATGALIEYLGEDDYNAKEKGILESYEAAAERHGRWKQN